MSRLLPILALFLVVLLCPELLIGQYPTPGKASDTPAAASSAPSAPSVRIGGYAQARETYRDGVGLTGSINRARLTAYGTAARM